MYFLLVAIAQCFAYFILWWLFGSFFGQPTTLVTKRTIYSLLIIFVSSALGISLSLSINDPEWSNRIMHALGGGFLSFLVCFLVVKDSQLKISRWQFFVFSFLIVSTLGVANEILEFFWQNYGHGLFATHINDTWLDLISNLVGILAASAVLVPRITVK